MVALKQEGVKLPYTWAPPGTRRGVDPMRAFSTILFALAIAVLPSHVRAEDDTDALIAFEKGRVLFNARKFPEAAEAFREANRIKPNWKLLFNIGQCEASARRHGLALEAFERYLTDGGDEIGLERKDLVIEEVKRLREMVGAIDVRAPRGSVVTVDGVERGTAPLAGHAQLSAGVEHRVVVVSQGQTVIDRMVRLTGGQTLVVDVQEPDPKADASDEQTESTEDGERGSGLRVWGIAAVSVGGAIVIGGVVTGAMALSLDGDLESDCEDRGCPPERQSERDKLDTLGVTTDVLIGVGAAAVIAGAVMLIVNARRGEGDSLSTVVRPSVGPGFAGLAFERKF